MTDLGAPDPRADLEAPARKWRAIDSEGRLLGSWSEDYFTPEQIRAFCREYTPDARLQVVTTTVEAHWDDETQFEEGCPDCGYDTVTLAESDEAYCTRCGWRN